MLWILWAIIVGLIAGFIARALVPGPNPMSILGTIALGLVGSLIGGFLGWILFAKDADSGPVQWSGLFGSIIGAIVALLILNALNRSKS